MLCTSPNPVRFERLRGGPAPAAPSDAESGYVLVAVIFLTVALLIALAIAAPKIAISIQRDKEMETIHRGEQYKRAIKLYYKKFGAYPTSIDQLVETNNIRFLRKRYIDPLTGKDDWKPVYFGQAHVRPLGFFGQPLGAVGAVGGTQGAAIISGSMYAIAPAAPVDGSTGGSTDASGSGTSAASSTGPTGTNTAGSTSSPFSMGGMNSNSMNSASSTTGSSPFGSSTTGSSLTGGTSATTFGGTGPIVGFTLPLNKASLIDYKKQTHYNQWEFNYDPMEDQMQSIAGLTGGTTNVNGAVPGQTGAPGANTSGAGVGTPGNTYGGSSPFGSSGSGSGTDSGSTGTEPPTSTPQQ